MRRVFKVFFIILSLTYPLSASKYDNDLLNTYMKLSPRFILMSTQKDLIDEKIGICLVYNEVDKSIADKFVFLTKEYYSNGIKNYPIEIVKNSTKEIEACSDSQLMFLLKIDEEYLEDIVKFAKKNKVLTIAYDAKYLKSGVDISLFLGRKILPYINMKTIQEKNIELDNRLLRISKIYTENKKWEY